MANSQSNTATEIAKKQADLAEAKRSHKAGELVNPRVLRETRREIARLKTQQRQSELTKKEEK